MNFPSSGPRDHSQASLLVEQLRPLGRSGARRVLRAAWAKLSKVEQAAIAEQWSIFGRSKQLPPPGPWKSWGFLCGRRFGKTLANSFFINGEVAAGRARVIGLAAQDEANCLALQVNGPDGLIATAPRHLKPVLHSSTDGPVLYWPNGARAYVRTPEVPGKIRGFGYDHSWLCEMQSWPNAHRVESFDMFDFATSLGPARTVWDCTPKKRHPILKELLARSAANPERHVVVRGSLLENAANLAPGYVDDIVNKFGGTQKGKEEIEGLMLEDSEQALVRQAWIDDARRNLPNKFARRVVSIDPSVSAGKGSDKTGIITAGLGVDGQGYVLRDDTGKYKPEEWAPILLDRYVQNECDLMVAERNKVGDLVAANIRSHAKERGLEVVVIGKDERCPPKQAGKVFVREVYARGAKDVRAEPVATAYERRRISHVIGANLAELEETLTCWEPEPNADSPGDLDALVHAMNELLSLTKNEIDPAAAFKGIEDVAKQLSAPTAPVVTRSLAQIISDQLGGGRGDRI